MRVFSIVVVFIITLGCDRASHPATNLANSNDPSKSEEKSAVVIPDDFDQRLLEVLRCPENLTIVRLATRKELDTANERVKKGKLKNWGDKVVTKPLKAMLIRADEKIGYQFEGAAPVMIIEEALVLDDTVGKPDPGKYRK